jgi:hypothetical protein
MDDTETEHEHENDRRTGEVRRVADRYGLIVIISVLGFMGTVVTSYATSAAQTQAALRQKVEIQDYVRDNAARDARIAANMVEIKEIHEVLADIKATGDATSIRVRQLVCRGQSEVCR